RPDVRQEELPALLARVVRVFAHVDGTDVIELLQVGRRRGIHGPRERLAAEGVVPARHRVVAGAGAALQLERQREERVRGVAEIVRNAGGNAVSGDGEETN